MPVKVDDPRDIQSAYDNLGSPLHDAETKGADDSAYIQSGIDQLDAYANDPANQIQSGDKKPSYTSELADKVKQSESSSSPNAPWELNRTVGKKSPPIAKGGKLKGALKKGGPFGALVGLLIGGAGIVSFFGGPGLLIVNFAEVLTEKFNYQLGVMDARYSKIVQAKLNNTTKGVCTSVTSRLCKYSTFSNKEIAAFEKAGIKVNKSGTGITGRTKIDSFEIDIGGETKTITASGFKKALKDIPEFKTAMRTAYNVKYSGFSDSIFSKVLSRFSTSKARPFTDVDSDDARTSQLDDITRNGVQEADLDAANICKKSDNCTNAEDTRNQAGADNASSAVDDAASRTDNAANRVLNEASSTVSEAAAEGTEKAAKEAVEEIASQASGLGLKTAWSAGSSTIKITGIADNVCMVYGWVKGFSFAAKAIRAAQIARYAMVFLTTASMIKAGDATSEDVNYLGNIMTKTVTTNGQTSKAATDSLGYRYAAYGDTGMTTSALNAVAGASFPAFIQVAIDTIINTIGRKGIDQTCHVLANPFVQVGSLIVGVASFFVGAGEVKFTAQAVIAPVIALIGAFLPAMLGEILAGKVVTDDTYGELSGDLITSGAAGLLSKSSTVGGNSILTRDQAVAYMQYQKQVVADYAETDRQTHSAFDASNPNTFLGSIYTRIIPYLNRSTSVTSTLSSIGSIVTSSLSNFTSPITSAGTTETYDTCSDMAVVELNMATDPYCNPVSGIPTEYINEDPEAVYNDLLSSGSIDSDGNPISQEYKDIITNCIDRESPYGVSNTDEVDTTGSCFIDSQHKANFYLFRADGRIVDDLETEAATAANTSSTSTSSNDSIPSIEGLPDGGIKDTTEGRKQAWALAQQFIDDLNAIRKGKSGYPFKDITNYTLGYNKSAGTPGKSASGTPCFAGASNCDQCYALSAWFLDKFTTQKIGTTSGAGDGVVAYLKKQGVPTGTVAKVYSVFSYGRAVDGSGAHTGIVIGIDGDYAITLENNWNYGGTLYINRRPIDGNKFRGNGNKTTFAYINDLLRDTPKSY